MVNKNSLCGEVAEGEMECVDELGKVQRRVEDRARTTTGAKETWCTRTLVRDTSFAAP